MTEQFKLSENDQQRLNLVRSACVRASLKVEDFDPASFLVSPTVGEGQYKIEVWSMRLVVRRMSPLRNPDLEEQLTNMFAELHILNVTFPKHQFFFVEKGANI